MLGPGTIYEKECVDVVSGGGVVWARVVVGGGVGVGEGVARVCEWAIGGWASMAMRRRRILIERKALYFIL
jgi:hypothetical protein